MSHVIPQVWSIRSMKNVEHWEEMFAALLQYKATHGNCLVPSRYAENTKLAKWVETMRNEYTKLGTKDTSTESSSSKPVSSSKLAPARVKRLDDVGFEWRVKGKAKRHLESGAISNSDNTNMDSVMIQPDGDSGQMNSTPKNGQWDQMFECLKQYHGTFGHTKVPKRYKEMPRLGIWVDTQVSTISISTLVSTFSVYSYLIHAFRECNIRRSNRRFPKEIRTPASV